MTKRETDNLTGALITVKQAAEITNLGTSTVRKYADEAGAVRRLGRCYRINREVLLSFVEQRCRG